jgi:predicted Zn-dependent peptidase
LLTDILGSGGSSRLYQSLVKEQRLFSHIDCYHFGSTDAGLLSVEGKLVKGIRMEAAEAAIQAALEQVCSHRVSDVELEKVKNKTESMMAFEDISMTNRASSLAMYELLGDAGLMNTELEKYRAVSTEDMLTVGQDIFRDENSNTLYYHAKS